MVLNPYWLSLLPGMMEEASPAERTPANILSQAYNTKGVRGVIDTFTKPIADQSAMAAKRPNINTLSNQRIMVESPLSQSPEELELARLQAMETPEYTQAAKNAENMQQLMQMGMEQEPRVSIAPITNLLDTWYGGNLSAGNKKQENAQELLQRLAGYQGEVSKQRKGLADIIAEYQKKVVPGAGRVLAETSIKEAPAVQKALGALNPGATFLGEREIGKFNFKITDAASEFASKLAPMEQAFTSGDIGQLGAATSLFARIIAGEKGVLTDRDIQRVIKDSIGKQWDEFQYYWNGKGAHDPETLASANKLITAAKAAFREGMSKKISSQENMYRSSKYYNQIYNPDMLLGAKESLDALGGFMPPMAGKVSTPRKDIPVAPKVESAPVNTGGFMSPKDFLKSKSGK